MRNAIALICATLFVVLPNTCDALTFRYTVPSTSALVVDSTIYNCVGGPPTSDVNITKLWWWPPTGGLGRVAMQNNVRFREGSTDSFVVSDSIATIGGHFWVTVSDTANNVSCPSNVVYQPGTTVTAVDPFGLDVFTLDEMDPVERVIVIDVHGRLVDGGPVANGIYFLVNVHRSGRTVSIGKRLYLRGVGSLP